MSASFPGFVRMRWVVLIAAMGAATCGGSCAGPNNGGLDERPPPSTPTTRSYVATNGDDRSDGSEQTPFRTIARALDADADEVIVRTGVFVEPEIVVTRAVHIRGEIGAVLAGHLLVVSNDVTVEGLDVLAGVSISLAERVTIATATITPSALDDTVSISSARATLKDLVLRCGVETCVQVTTATATLEGLRLSTEIASKRGIRVQTGSVSASQIDVVGMMTSQVQANDRSWLRLRGARLRDSRGNAIITLSSRLLADDVTVTNSRSTALLSQRSETTLRDSHLGATTTLTVGVQAGEVALYRTVVEGSLEGTLSASAYREEVPTVRLVDATIAHGLRVGLLQSAGALHVVRGRFVGDETAPPTIDNADAIISRGMDTVLTVAGTTFVRPAGAAIVASQHVSATITATITAPRTTGIVIEDARINPILIRGGRIDDCARESGIAVLDSEQVTIEGVAITGCAEAAVLAGEESTVRVVATRAIDNPGFGYAAFGASTITLERSVARGSQWATFSTCADGAAVVDGGGNTLEGATTECP